MELRNPSIYRIVIVTMRELLRLDVRSEAYLPRGTNAVGTGSACSWSVA